MAQTRIAQRALTVRDYGSPDWTDVSPSYAPCKGPLTALCSWSMATRHLGVHVPKMAFAWAPFWPRPRVKSDLRRIDAFALGPCVRESPRRAELLAVPLTT
jgi:hypothetical protein